MRKLSILFILVSSLASCMQEDTPAPNNNSSSGTQAKTLEGTTWVLTQYQDTGMTYYISRHDTLVFINDHVYKYNGIIGDYHYYYSDNAYQDFLELGNTPFGDLRGAVPQTIQTYGEINACRFGNLIGGVYYMWFVRQ